MTPSLRSQQPKCALIDFMLVPFSTTFDDEGAAGGVVVVVDVVFDVVVVSTNVIVFAVVMVAGHLNAQEEGVKSELKEKISTNIEFSLDLE